MNQMNANAIQAAHPMQVMQGPNGAMIRGADGSGTEQMGGVDYKTQLNTVIYDYFLKCEQWDLARQMLKNSSLPVKCGKVGARKPGDDDDSKDDANRPSDLPPPTFSPTTLSGDGIFLLDWFSIFFDMLAATHNQAKPQHNPLSSQYLQHTSHQNRLQQQQQQHMLSRTMMPGAGMNPQSMMMNNRVGAMGDMRRQAAAANMMGLNQQQRNMLQNQQRMMAQQNSRETGVMDVDGQRPHTPSSGDNAPSPSKRPRIENPAFNQQMMQNGVMQQGMPNGPDMQRMVAQNLLVQNGVNPSQLTTQQMNTFQQQNPQVQNKSIQVYKQNMHAHTAQRAMSTHGSPMMNPGMDMQQMPGANPDFYAGNNARNAGGANGHALQDYQMQLMLLERQNRRRLEMAKQEQDNDMQEGQNGMLPQYPPNMSPSGSRQGPSPNPSEQMKRGTPKMGQAGIPGSPMPDPMQQRASPSAMNYNQMPPAMENGMPIGPNGMRPPSSHPQFLNGTPITQQQMAALRNSQQAGGPGQAPMNGAMGQGPMGPGLQPGPGQMGTPQQRAMPPPQGVPPQNTNATGRAPSPAPSATASTPQQSNKANPKKKDTKKAGKPANKKGGTAAPTPADGQDNPPATPTSATPITPAMNNAAFEKNKSVGGPAPATQPPVVAHQQPTAAAPAPPPPPPPPPAPQQPDPAATSAVVNGSGGAVDSGAGIQFPGMEAMDPGLSMDFSSMEAGDVLDQFNFDAFIDEPNQDFGAMNFDMGFDGGMDSGAVDA